METVEMLVFIGFATIVGVLLVYFIADIPFLETHEEIKNGVMDIDNHEMKSGDFNLFLKTALEFWDEGRSKDKNVTATVYMDEPRLIDKTVLFNEVSALHRCETLQSKEMGCGSREDVVMGSIIGPAVVNLRIEDGKLYISPQAENYQKKYNMNDLITFGGFEGQGTLSKLTEEFPDDAIFLGMRLKVNTGSDFKIFINNRQCGGIFETGNIVERYDLGSCTDLLRPGVVNNISIRFQRGGQIMKYFGGGYLQIDYMTFSPEETRTHIYNFPGIAGSINLYSSFYVPGDLVGMQAYLHYLVDNSTKEDLHLVIGDTVLLNDSEKEKEKTVTYSSSQMSSMLDLDDFSHNTVPLRLSSSQEIEQIINVTGNASPVDVILITDLSGSMDDPLGGSSSSSCGTPSTEKREVARCVDRLFINVLLNDTLNRMGLVAYGEYVPDYQMVSVTNDSQVLLDQVDTYSENLHYTCISCGILAAIQLLAGSANNKTIIVMTDGMANRCVDDTHWDPSSSWDCGGSATNHAVLLANQARDAGIEVYAVAFGNDADRDTMEHIADDPDHYAEGNDAESLERLYKDLAQEIVGKHGRNKTQEIVQTVYSSLNQSQNSTLYPDSYLKLDYTPSGAGAGLTDLQFRVETKLTSCSNVLHMPVSFRVTEAYLLAFSGMFWTKDVDINGVAAFDLASMSGLNLQNIGDPFQIYIKPGYLVQGDNTIDLAFTGNIDESIGCWNPVYNDNTFIYYAALLNSAMPAGLDKANGCRWHIEFDDGTTRNYRIPLSYAGNEECNFTSTSQGYNEDDAISWAMFTLMSEIDTDGDFRLPSEIEDIQFYDYMG